MPYLLLVSIAVSLLWIPVLLFFFKNWRTRNNPISMAICGMVLFVIYSDALIWAAALLHSEVPFYVMQTAEICSIMFFYLSLRWAKKRFGPSMGYPPRIDS
jgi:uncharacterized membrane protein